MPLNSHLSTSTQIILVWRKGSTPTNTFYFFSDRTQPRVFFRKEYHAPRVLRKFHRNRISESKVLCLSTLMSTQIILVWRKGSTPTNTFYFFSDRTQPRVFFRKEYHAPRVLRKFHRNRISESKVLCHFMRLPPSLRLGGNFICIPVESFKPQKR